MTSPTSPTANPDRRAEILRMAAEIFCQKGYHATSMGEVAEAVELTKAGLYHYVEGKEDLLFSIVSFGMDRLEGWIDAARQVDDPERRLESLVSAHAAAITLDGSAITLLVDGAEGLKPDHRRSIRARQRAYVEFVRENLEQLQADGRLKPVDTTVAAFSLLGAVMWTARWYRPDGRLSGTQVSEQIAEIALRGFLKQAKEKSKP